MTAHEKLIADLDKWFSIYIRLRDANEAGFITCISCGRKVYWKDADAGHYIPRKHMATRFDEVNVNSQCIDCNRYMRGNIDAYREGIIALHGSEMYEKLEAMKFQTFKLSDAELKEMRTQVKEEIKRLKEEKKLK